MSPTKTFVHRWASFGVIAGCAWATVLAAEPYKNADEALREGVKFAQQRDYKSAQAPLEAALTLAPDDEFRQKVYRMLMSSYRLLPEPDKMVEAAEFVIAHTDDFAERSNVAGSLRSFLFQRGKLDDARKRYEAILAKQENDLVALAMMTAIATGNREDREQLQTYRSRLEKVERELAARLAVKEEGLAAQGNLSSWHWKQAAMYWNLAVQPVRAVKAARQAETVGPDTRSDILQHFWHRHLGEVFLNGDDPASAIRHLEKAIETTTIQGYKDDCKKLLAIARQNQAVRKP